MPSPDKLSYDYDPTVMTRPDQPKPAMPLPDPPSRGGGFFALRLLVNVTRPPGLGRISPAGCPAPVQGPRPPEVSEKRGRRESVRNSETNQKKRPQNKDLNFA